MARSLQRARAEAAERSARIVRAAAEVVAASPDGDFTVQAVVERLGISTRTFYQHFSSKDDLVVAMFEEAQRDSARLVQRAVAASDDPLERLRIFVLARQEARLTPLTRLFIHRHFVLQETHPEELRHAREPVAALLRELVADAAAAGAIEVDDVDVTTTMILQTVTAAVHARLLDGSGPTPSPEQVWEFCLRGISPRSAFR